ncbi:hypothetical protein LTR02_014631 [Friedmanniomyces endolithicus]|nr:hypothetical protein LTR03_004885 [Friedmanniomyces endolithicus]KAK0890539.1 hypothetical protein LTR02_014631 [Friedmanniomyces endolithicus]KAK1031600.1 hypothetical protein LTS16_017922 [Friedmanniomyces endolithicus]
MHPWLLLTRTLESSYGHNTTDLDSQPTRSIQASEHDVLARREHITSANPVVSAIHLGKRSPQNVNDDYCLATHLSNGQNWGYCSGPGAELTVYTAVLDYTAWISTGCPVSVFCCGVVKPYGNVIVYNPGPDSTLMMDCMASRAGDVLTGTPAANFAVKTSTDAAASLLNPTSGSTSDNLASTSSTVGASSTPASPSSTSALPSATSTTSSTSTTTSSTTLDSSSAATTGTPPTSTLPSASSTTSSTSTTTSSTGSPSASTVLPPTSGGNGDRTTTLALGISIPVFFGILGACIGIYYGERSTRNKRDKRRSLLRQGQPVDRINAIEHITLRAFDAIDRRPRSVISDVEDEE